MEAVNLSIPSIGELTEGNAVFSPFIQVWGSRYGDPQWFYYTESVAHNPKALSNSINWDSFVNGTSSSRKVVYGNIPISHQVVDDLKVSAAIYSYYPNIFKHSKKQYVDPKTVKGRVSEARAFIGLVTSKSEIDFGVKINSLSDISFEMLKRYIPQYSGRSSHLKRGLQLIAHPVVQKNMENPPLWATTDLESKSLQWKEVAKHKGISRLTDSQFLWLLEYTKKRISEFKTLLDLKVRDKSLEDLGSPEILIHFAEAKRAMDWLYNEENSKPVKAFWMSNFGFSSREFSGWLDDVHNSAMLIVLLFTGMRETELQLLEKGCHEERHGFNFLNSRVVKQRAKDAPSVEGWLAIDFVMDAYDILCEFQDYLDCDYLIASIKKAETTGLPYKQSVLNTKYNRWLKKIDERGLFTDSFSVHQCRETLVYQLARHEVGLPFISMQLKHFNRRFTNMPNEVSAGYGEYRRVLMDGIQQHQSEAREQVLNEMYGENANFAGGGAEKHKQRVDSFFTGLGLFGEEREQYIKRMARQNIKLMPTSIGTCNHNFIATSEDTPPCYGDYSCDPDCENHLISESCGNALRERKKHVQQYIDQESDSKSIEIWNGLVSQFDKHLHKLEGNNG